jgi:hypothetical protein
MRLSDFRSCGLVATLAFLPHSVAMASSPEPRAFAMSRIHLERNLTDGDAEAVIEVVAGDCGLSVLTVTGPDGKVVANFRAPAEATLGLRELIRVA